MHTVDDAAARAGGDEPAARAARAERERLLAELGAERERLRAVILSMPSPLALHVGPEHRFALVNAAFRRISGGGRDDTGLTVREAFPELPGQGIIEALDRVYATGEPWVGAEVPIRYDRDGTGPQDTWYNVRYEPVRDAGGAVWGVLNFAFDVTDQVRARREVERLLAESERARAEADAERLRTAALQGITAALAEARTLDDVAAVVTGPMADAAGARAGSLAVPTPAGDALTLVRVFGFPDAVLPAIRRQPLDLASPIPECFRTGAPVWAPRRDGPGGMDARYPAVAPAWSAAGVASGAYVPLPVAGRTAGVIAYAFAEPRAFAEPERAFLLALGRQVAVAVERARLWEAERAAREEAERANRTKGEFLAVMSHELRTPLNAIGGYAELLALGVRGPLTAAQAQDLDRLRRANQHLTALVTDVLNFARLDAGRVEFRAKPVRLGPLVADLESLVGPQLAAKGLAYDHDDCGPDTPERPHVARADAEKVRQVLLNLLTNAVKFTDAGGRVALACEDDAAAGVVRVRVADTGRGIAPDALERVFEPFVQVDRHRVAESQQGVGLGLAISRDLARGMGGDLTAESTPGAGSTFTLTLPRA